MNDYNAEEWEPKTNLGRMVKEVRSHPLMRSLTEAYPLWNWKLWIPYSRPRRRGHGC